MDIERLALEAGLLLVRCPAVAPAEDAEDRPLHTFAALVLDEAVAAIFRADPANTQGWAAFFANHVAALKPLTPAPPDQG